MSKQKHYIALGAVILAALVILSLPPRAASRSKLAISSLFLPLFGLAGAAQQLPSAVADTVLPRRELLKQIETLKRENDQLRVQAFQAAATERENEQLRALVGWEKQAPWKLKLAKVIMRDPANWWRTIQIDLGSLDGIRADLPVLTSDGLVGRVSAVYPHRAQVVLIGDPNCKVSALVENQAQDTGIITVGGPLDGSLVELSYLSSSVNLKPGQEVVTSGLGGIFPKGIPIGQVVDMSSVEFGLYTEARIKLSANLGALEQVWVLLQ